jgi:flagellar biosynthetic protein FliR
MAGLAPLLPQSIAVFLLMLVRVGTMLMLMPGFSGRSVPAPIKVIFSVVVTLTLVPFSQTNAAQFNDPGRFAVGVGQEFLVGLLMGFGIALIFGAVEMAAGLINIQMGLNLSPAFNPSFNMTGGALDTFYMLIASLIFFGADAHHLLILALQRSFVTIPVGAATFSQSGQQTLAALTEVMFVDALRIGLPVAGTLLLADVALGILSRMVPQMNVFFVGLPAKMLVGFGLILLTMPFLLGVLHTMMSSGLVDMVSRSGGLAR